MARVSSKRLVFVVFVFLCFISSTNGARSLAPMPPSIEAEKGKNYVLAPAAAAQENGVQQNGEDELVTVDYTPARRKPPIHN